MNIFLKKYPEFDGDYCMITESEIELLNVSDSYDPNGIRISASEAGDYIMLETKAAANEATRTYRELHNSVKSYNIHDIVSAHDEWELYDELMDSTNLVEGVDYSLYKENVRGFNYWDGHNWRTVTVSGEYPTHEVETDEEIIQQLNEAFDNKIFVEDEWGFELYEYEDITIKISHFASSWDDATLTFN